MEHCEGFGFFFSPSCNGTRVPSRDFSRRLGKRASYSGSWFLLPFCHPYFKPLLFVVAPPGHPGNLKKLFLGRLRTRLPLLPSSQRPKGEIERTGHPTHLPGLFLFASLLIVILPSPHQHEDTEWVIIPCPHLCWGEHPMPRSEVAGRCLQEVGELCYSPQGHH